MAAGYELAKPGFRTHDLFTDDAQHQNAKATWKWNELQNKGLLRKGEVPQFTRPKLKVQACVVARPVQVCFERFQWWRGVPF